MNNTADVQSGGKPYFGRKKELDTIRAALANYRESASFNIVGNYGSGRSALLAHIEDQITQHVWEFPQHGEPIVVILQGSNFVRGENFIEFLGNQITEKIAQAAEIPVDSQLDFPLLLSKAAAQDHPIIIMIDNFTRIIERLDRHEAQGLNRLRPAGVHYILVTDHRTIEAISPEVYEASDYFKFTRPLYLKPLGRDEATELVRQEIATIFQNRPLEVENQLLDIIVQIAGGLPGLLQAVASYFCFQMGEGHFDGVIHPNGDRRTTRFLRYLPVESAIRYYLNLLLETVITELSLVEKHHLVEIALERQAPELNELDIDLENKFRIMGLLTPGALRISGKLMQYTLLNNVVPVSFSGVEYKVFDKFYHSRPGLTSFEDLALILKDEAPAPENTPAFRQYIDSTVARIRKKIKELPNRAAFSITNERGLGFFAKTEISFDEFYFHPPSIFWNPP